MHCPKCGAEFLRGVRECFDCHLPLVAHPVVRPDHHRPQPGKQAERSAQPVTVFEGGDPIVVAMAKGILESAGIRFMAKGEGIQDLFGAGRFPGGVNLLTGPVRLQVAREYSVQARRLLKTLNIE